MVMMYGGVPIIDNVQNPIIGDSEGIHLVVPRSSTKECIDFICKDLQTAADYLPARWESENKNFGRITSGAALALKGRVELLYASPLFNRADDVTRWETAYQTNLAAVKNWKKVILDWLMKTIQERMQQVGERYSPIILAQKVVEELFLRQY